MPLMPQLSRFGCDETGGDNGEELGFDDWLRGIENTVRHSLRRSGTGDESKPSVVPCSLSSVTKMMTKSVAHKFQSLFRGICRDAGIVSLFSDSVTDMLRKFATDTFAVSLGALPDESDTRVPAIMWTLCAYTVMCAENYLNYRGGVDDGSEGALFGALPSRQAECLVALVRVAAATGSVTTSTVVRDHCVDVISALVSEMQSADGNYSNQCCLLSLDLFHLLVSLVLSLPFLYAEEQDGAPASTHLQHVPCGRLNDLHALKLVFTAHLVQCIVSTEISDDVVVVKETDESMVTDAMETDQNNEEALAFLATFIDIRQKSSRMVDERNISASRLLESIRKASLRFLRYSAIFFHYLTSVPAPLELFEKRENVCEEYALLCRYLGLSADLTSHLTSSVTLQGLVNMWCCDCAKLSQLPVKKEAGSHLVSLPDDYSELINETSVFSCPRSPMGDDSRSPALCLLCGTIVCSQSYCCQTQLKDGSTVGAATAHAQTCAAGTGIFLRVRDCQILLLSGANRGCFLAPPYLDAYGETDEGLRRGDALKLCAARYERLNKLWLAHGIPEEVVHVLEANSGLLSFDWHHL